MRVTENTDKVTRLWWLKLQLDTAHSVDLTGAYTHACDLVNQSVPPEPSFDMDEPVWDEEHDESKEIFDEQYTRYEHRLNEYQQEFAQWEGAVKRLEDLQVYARLSIKTLEEIPPAFGTIESELSHAFIWHISPQGEAYWMDVVGIYGDRRMKLAQARAKTAQEQMRESAAAKTQAKLDAARQQLADDEAFMKSQESPTPDKTDHGVISDEDVDLPSVQRIERDSSVN